MLGADDLFGSAVVALIVEDIDVRRYCGAARVTHAALNYDTDTYAFAWGCF
jgi:hypothetical protein